MNALVYHIASGQAFFTGIALVVLAAAASTAGRPVIRRLMAASFLLGGFAIFVSSTAIPYAYYALALVVTGGWAVSQITGRRRRPAAMALACAWLLAGALEAPYHIAPRLELAPAREMTVIGDSVTAGMGGDDAAERWPSLLAQQHDLEVQDISHVGETAASALTRTAKVKIESSVVFLEIGGNDLLGFTSAGQFEQDLDALLAHVGRPDRQLIMFELPLPPLRHEYGRIQRTLARKHGVALVPKRLFLSVLAADDATVDTIHLTQVGHNRMAECVWRLVRSAFSEAEGE